MTLNTLDAIEQRRAVKHYEPDFEMPAADEQKLFELARKSPTSFNMQNWRFVNVKDKALRAQIEEAAWNQKQVTQASLLIILCADVHAWDKDPARYWADAPQEAQDILVPMIKPFYAERKWQQRDEAMRSIGIAGQTLMLAAKAMGYDSCPMIGFDTDKVGDLINLPDNHVAGMMITIGKAAKPAWSRPGTLPEDEVVITDRF